MVWADPISLFVCLAFVFYNENLDNLTSSVEHYQDVDDVPLAKQNNIKN